MKEERKKRDALRTEAAAATMSWPRWRVRDVRSWSRNVCQKDPRYDGRMGRVQVGRDASAAPGLLVVTITRRDTGREG
jgi:hypothetical protein